MSFPLPSTSIFDKNVKALKVNPIFGPEIERLNLYQTTLEDIVEILYDDRIKKGFGEDFVSTMSTDLGKIIRGVRRVKGFDKTKEFIEKAKIELGVALSLFDDSEEPDFTKRVRERLIAFNNCKNFLDKALQQWPSS